FYAYVSRIYFAWAYAGHDGGCNRRSDSAVVLVERGDCGPCDTSQGSTDRCGAAVMGSLARPGMVDGPAGPTGDDCIGHGLVDGSGSAFHGLLGLYAVWRCSGGNGRQFPAPGLSAGSTGAIDPSLCGCLSKHLARHGRTVR